MYNIEDDEQTLDNNVIVFKKHFRLLIKGLISF